jgi:O-acetyl-ADP-ribose deacetylase (regulator of RNase III)
MRCARFFMPTTFVTGDLFAEPLPALAHGCNCAGAMGKGIAIEFRKRFPAMYAEYKRRCADKRFALGGVFAWTEPGVTVYNLGTHKSWRTKAELPAVETSLREMVRLAEASGIARIGMPRIGAGLGGLDWAVVRALLQSIGEMTTVELVVFETFSR